MKRQATKWEKILSNYVFGKLFTLRMYRIHSKFKSKKAKKSIRKWAKEQNTSPKKTYKWQICT